ncbi:predicted protein [Uncinocarpus reesii 1704]|uniref:MSP domain-containing protein n=1 Tax=Uncinocarpus reesii (strain UAMH 1704) TaxID=336963 RepID=C4JSX8_UNCRE|nr:uncharacterized protein UREG_05567 [Uncinocarpus reesii 1704]EEP80725.1 predicted protein [Uncinocarpus reesii 1704]
MSVELDPPELGFRRIALPPLPCLVKQTAHRTAPILRQNHSSTKVRMHSQLRTGWTILQIILLQAMKDEPPPDAKCKDKFLVQSVAVSADKEFSNVASIWQDVEKTAKHSIQERKIRVNFLPALDDAQPNGIASEDESTTLHASPVNAKFETPSMPTRAAPVIAEPPIQPPKFQPEPSESTILETPKPVAEDVKSERSTEPSEPKDDLKSQLDEARVQIQQLKQQVAENELRRRKVATEGSTSPEVTTLQQQSHSTPQMGVPLQVVAGLCLISFLLAYIFF